MGRLLGLLALLGLGLYGMLLVPMPAAKRAGLLQAPAPAQAAVAAGDPSPAAQGLSGTRAAQTLSAGAEVQGRAASRQDLPAALSSPPQVLPASDGGQAGLAAPVVFGTPLPLPLAMATSVSGTAAVGIGGEDRASPSDPDLFPAFTTAAFDSQAEDTEARPHPRSADPWAYRHIRAARANLRYGPSTGHGVISQLASGEEVQVIEDSGTGWLLVRIEGDGVEGWVAASLLSP